MREACKAFVNAVHRMLRIAPRDPPASSIVVERVVRSGSKGVVVVEEGSLDNMELHNRTTPSPQSPSPITMSYFVMRGSADIAVLLAWRRAGMREGGAEMRFSF